MGTGLNEDLSVDGFGYFSEIGYKIFFEGSFVLEIEFAFLDDLVEDVGADDIALEEMVQVVHILFY